MKEGFNRSEKGIEYEVYKGQIMVEHKNGFYGCLYGKSSMSIFHKGKEVLHTGFRNIETADELYETLEDMPELMDILKDLSNEDE